MALWLAKDTGPDLYLYPICKGRFGEFKMVCYVKCSPSKLAFAIFTQCESSMLQCINNHLSALRKGWRIGNKCAFMDPEHTPVLVRLCVHPTQPESRWELVPMISDNDAQEAWGLLQIEIGRQR